MSLKGVPRMYYVFHITHSIYILRMSGNVVCDVSSLNFFKIRYNVIEAVPTLFMFHVHIYVIDGYAELINVLK